MEKIWICWLQLFPTNRVQNCCSLEKVGSGMGEGRGLLPVKAFYWPRLTWGQDGLDFPRNPQSCAPFPPSSFSLCILPSFFPVLSHYIFLLFHPSLLPSIPSPNAASNYTLHSTLRLQPSIQIIPWSTAYTHFSFPLHFSLSSYYIPPFHLPSTCFLSILPLRFSPILLLRPAIPASHYMLPSNFSNPSIFSCTSSTLSPPYCTPPSPSSYSIPILPLHIPFHPSPVPNYHSIHALFPFLPWFASCNPSLLFSPPLQCRIPIIPLFHLHIPWTNSPFIASSPAPYIYTVLRTSNMQNKRVDPWKRARPQNTCNVFQLTCGFPLLLNWWWIFLWFTVFNPRKSHLYLKFPNEAPPNSFCVLHTACRQFLAPHWSAGWAVISHHTEH
jgi:hypothetical protein